TAEIVGGGYAPGATIPSERELSEVFGVNRHVIREAVKRLEQVGLVKVAQGGRTKVLDFRQSAGLDLLALLAERSGALEAALPLLAAALEMRAGIGADLARLCALRLPAPDRGGDRRARRRRRSGGGARCSHGAARLRPIACECSVTEARAMKAEPVPDAYQRSLTSKRADLTTVAACWREFMRH